MKNKIIILKQRIDKNKYEMKKDSKDICDLLKPILEMIDLLLLENISNNKIKDCLEKVNGSLKIIEEKLSIVENKD